VHRSHKTGYVLMQKLLRRQKRRKQVALPWTQSYHYLEDFPKAHDFRMALILRNFHSAVVSGYLYHKSGYECTVRHDGAVQGENWTGGAPWLVRPGWESQLSFELPSSSSTARRTAKEENSAASHGDDDDDDYYPPVDNRTACRYLAETPERIGLRVYLDLAFRTKYRTCLTNFVLARQFRYLKERTKVWCFEELADPNRVERSVREILRFLYNVTSEEEQQLARRQKELGQREDSSSSSKNKNLHPLVAWRYEPKMGDAGRHGTTRDPVVRSRLRRLVKEIDSEYYGGALEWLDDVLLPCKAKGGYA